MPFEHSLEGRRCLGVVDWQLTVLRPIGNHQRPQSAVEGEHDAQDETRTALQAARGAPPDHLTEQPAEIEAAGVNEKPLEDVCPASQVGTSHAAGLVHVREGALDSFAAQPLELLAACTTCPATIGIDSALS